MAEKTSLSNSTVQNHFTPQALLGGGVENVASVAIPVTLDESNTCPRHGANAPMSQRRHTHPDLRSTRTRIFIDTETFGLFGIPFLIQFQIEGDAEITIIHVLERQPKEILEIIESLAQPSMIWVGHNLSFDLMAISKLATVAAMVDDWSFESIWAAERLWRGEVNYQERLQHLRLVYPAAVEDTYIAACSLPPLEEQFMKSPAIHFKNLPVAILPELENTLREALSRKPCHSDTPHAPDVGAILRSKVDRVTNRKERDQVRAIQARQDFTVLREVTISLKNQGLYSLKSVARLLGMPDEACPTIRNRDLAKRLYDFILKRQHDPAFLEYARRDVDMLSFVHHHYVQQPGYSTLAHDFDVLPFMANLRLCGVHVDPAKVAATQQHYRSQIDESQRQLQAAGLDNFNSSGQVARFVNRLLSANLGKEAAAKYGWVRDMKDETLASVVSMLTDRLGKDHPAARQMKALTRARSCATRRSFFENVVGDSLYPQFKIKGTQTDRMTSHGPSIQNMPAKVTEDEDEDGIQFRSAFTAPSGYQLLVGDFDQFEMRLVAAVAQEPALIEAFAKGVDTHSLTALRTAAPQIRAGDPLLAQASDDELLGLLIKKDPRVKHFRTLGKVLNFAILYGATEYGIARQASTTLDQAKSMLAAFHVAYPALSRHVRDVHSSLTTLQIEWDFRGFQRNRLVTPRAARVANRVGVTRSFELPLRMVQILGKLGLSTQIGVYLPALARPMSAVVPYYRKHKTPAKVVQSELRSAARQMQAYIHRQAYNFLIQSLGAYHTKRLQVALARPFIPAGIYRAADLSVLPGINVHDEIHLYTKLPPEQFRQIASNHVAEVSRELGVPIKFEFATVTSWAEKS